MLLFERDLVMHQELDRGDSQPYFIWDVPVTVDQLRAKLRHGKEDEKIVWMARILREARFDDVWRFVSIDEVLARVATGSVAPRTKAGVLDLDVGSMAHRWPYSLAP